MRSELKTESALSVYDQILGFTTEGKPVVPVTVSGAAVVDTTAGALGRREKLGWEEITKQSAKVISFIGMWEFFPTFPLRTL